MSLSKTYDPSIVEDKWYQQWEKNGLFRSVPDERKPYTIVIPPPNVTGVLHMGHMLNNTIQDVLIRRARLLGYNACWVPGTDHASIATEAKVVRMLREKGINKSNISRDDFMKHAWAWTDKYGGTILQQLRKLGASCDWHRTRFTMEPKLYDAVIDVFIDLYNKGYIYRGLKMVNWDPEAQTTLSNEEVIHKDVQSKFYHIRYRVAGSEDFVTIATTRPETILGDTAIAVHPRDERYLKLHGKKAIVPLVEREVPIIADDYVDMELGTGALKVTPAHDANDYEIGLRHQLKTIDILNPNGTMSPAAQWFVGEDRFVARKKVIKELEERGHLVKVTELQNKVGYSERTDAVVEPRLSMQWFVDMQKLVKPALDAVVNGDIRFYPSKFINLYKHWMENIRDWPISRQLWWGQRIPAWYAPNGEVVVAKTKEEAFQSLKLAANTSQLEDLRQDEDVLDTWFSSWLWPLSVFDGFLDPNNKDISYYYPTSVLVTAPDIIFFWVARMIMAGYEYRKDKPFHHVYFTGMVRDKQRRKMSKSLGNSPEPLDLIAKYGADGVRVGMLLSSPAGNDLLFDEKLCEQGRNFCNKIWNALRLVKGWEVVPQARPSLPPNPLKGEPHRILDTPFRGPGGSDGNATAIRWFESRLNQTITQLNKQFEDYNLSEALKTLYSFIWDDFCSWYLEFVKPASPAGRPEKGKAIDPVALDKTIEFFDKLMRLLHPFMPFISEEVWQQLGPHPNPSPKERGGLPPPEAIEKSSFIMTAAWPEAGAVDEEMIRQGVIAMQLITGVRDIRSKAGLKNSDTVTLAIETDQRPQYEAFVPLICKLANAGALNFETGVTGTAFVLGSDKIVVSTGQAADPKEERARLQKELDYTRGFIRSIESKLNNSEFVDGAPAEVVERERSKLRDGQEKLKSIEEALSQLN